VYFVIRVYSILYTNIAAGRTQHSGNGVVNNVLKDI